MSAQVHNEQLFTMLQTIRQTQIDEVAKAAEHRGMVVAKFEGLCGEQGRVTKLEAYNERQAWKSYGKHALTVIVAIAGQKAAKLIGWNL